MKVEIFKKEYNIGLIFLATVVVPTIISVAYFGIFASDVYISESRFVVRSPERKNPQGLSALLEGAGFSNASDEIYAAHDYVLSRDALNQLNKNNDFVRSFRSNDISIFDRFNPLGLNGTFEKLYTYYLKKVSVDYDSRSTIATVTVRAYHSQDAYKINRHLLDLAESMVNKLNYRARHDLIKYALVEVDEAKIKARQSSVALAKFRNQKNVVDPKQQASIQLQMISKLQDELISAKGQLLQLKSFTPQNPQIPVLQERVENLAKEVSGQTNLVAGGDRSLAGTAVEYQRLELENQFAEKQLAMAMASLQESRNEARRQQVYLERIVEPNKPDGSNSPRRVRGVIATIIVGLVMWGIVTILLAGVKEHHD